MSKFDIGVIACVLLLAGCGEKENNDAEQKIISVSIEPLRQIVEQIAGADYTVKTILDKGANPETFEPSMSRRAMADKSEVFFTLGAFPFELRLTDSAGSKTRVANVSENIELIYGTHGHGHDEPCEHETVDPHTWTSAKNASAIVRNVAKVLSEVNPSHKKIYENRCDSMISLIDSLDRQIEIKLAESPTRSFAIWHPSLSYFARDYGLKQIAVGQENKEISPRHVKSILDNVRNENVKVFFFQKEFDSRQAVTINESMGTRLVLIDPLAYDWISQLETIADELSK